MDIASDNQGRRMLVLRVNLAGRGNLQEWIYEQCRVRHYGARDPQRAPVPHHTEQIRVSVMPRQEVWRADSEQAIP